MIGATDREALSSIHWQTIVNRSSRLLGAFLFGVGAADAITWLASAGILGTVGAIACDVPRFT